MSYNYIPHSWNLLCPWCKFYIVVNPRGMRGDDMGSGYEAAEMMKQHILIHNKSWDEFLKNA